MTSPEREELKAKRTPPMTDTTEIDLERLKELLAETTQGKWVAYAEPLRAAFPTTIVFVADQNRQEIIKWGGFDGPDAPGAKSLAKRKGNAEFIAAAHNALPALIAEHEALLSKVSEMKEALEKIAAMGAKTNAATNAETIWEAQRIAQAALASIPTGGGDETQDAANAVGEDEREPIHFLHGPQHDHILGEPEIPKPPLSTGEGES